MNNNKNKAQTASSGCSINDMHEQAKSNANKTTRVETKKRETKTDICTDTGKTSSNHPMRQAKKNIRENSKAYSNAIGANFNAVPANK
jgi:hypothetical protein